MRIAPGIEQNVRWLEVPMQYPALMGVVNGSGDLKEIGERELGVEQRPLTIGRTSIPWR